MLSITFRKDMYDNNNRNAAQMYRNQWDGDVMFDGIKKR